MIKAIKRVLRSAGIEVTRYKPETSNSALLRKCLDHFAIDLVIDVGANIGQYGMTLREAGYQGELISFEPLRDAFETLKQVSGRYNNWKPYNYGVGSANGKTVINVSKNVASSSILNVTRASTEAEPLTETSRKEEITIVSLDSFFGTNPTHAKRIYLKVDVQGYELQVLEGAEDLVAHATIVQLEMSFVPLYDGGPLYREVLDKMDKAGFEVYSILPDFRDMTSGRMLQADGIFVNKRQTARS